jgi:phosphatidylethanolamine-binding protein (PEBP) family uncharacterized protein
MGVRVRWVVVCTAAGALLMGCGGGSTSSEPGSAVSKTVACSLRQSSVASSANQAGSTMMFASRALAGENSPMPSKYTCDGANISPPLVWNVPAKTAALMLVMTVIDNAGSSVRWIVSDISANSKGVGEGQTPEGGIVGANAEGHSNYGGICPPRGQTGSVQFELYALSKKLPLTQGFSPATAEHDYSGDLLHTAVVKSVYSRR